MKYFLTILIFCFCLPINSWGQEKKGKRYEMFGIGGGRTWNGTLELKEDGTFIFNYVFAVKMVSQGHPRKYVGKYKVSKKTLELIPETVDMKIENKIIENDGIRIRSQQPVYGEYPANDLPISRCYRVFKKNKTLYLVGLEEITKRRKRRNAIQGNRSFVLDKTIP